MLVVTAASENAEISSVGVGNQERVCSLIPTRGDLHSVYNIWRFLRFINEVYLLLLLLLFCLLNLFDLVKCLIENFFKDYR